jgi:hypothetical protein
MRAKLDRESASATPKAAAGKLRLFSAAAAAAGGPFRRTSSGPLPAAGGRASSDGGGLVWLTLRLVWLRSWGFGFGSAGFGWVCGFGAGLICIWSFG